MADRNDLTAELNHDALYFKQLNPFIASEAYRMRIVSAYDGGAYHAPVSTFYPSTTSIESALKKYFD